jgi:hypothetical protein
MQQLTAFRSLTVTGHTGTEREVGVCPEILHVSIYR